MNALKRLLHILAASPWMYELMQFLVGGWIVRYRLARQIGLLPAPSLIVDMGGGTGIYRELWPQSARYFCFDLDKRKLEGFRGRHSSGAPILADASQTPLKGSQADIVLCTSVSHHLPDETWNQLLCESSRILKPGGIFILVDAVWAPQRWIGRIIWRLDRGSFPHTGEALRAALSDQFEVITWDRFAVLHEYVIGVAISKTLREAKKR